MAQRLTTVQTVRLQGVLTVHLMAQPLTTVQAARSTLQVVHVGQPVPALANRVPVTTARLTAQAHTVRQAALGKVVPAVPAHGVALWPTAQA